MFQSTFESMLTTSRQASSSHLWSREVSKQSVTLRGCQSRQIIYHTPGQVVVPTGYQKLQAVYQLI